QAEDGIRDFHVAGVQTCALPICRTREPLVVNFMPGYPARQVFDPALAARLSALVGDQPADVRVTSADKTDTVLTVAVATDRGTRSEERRVASEGAWGWRGEGQRR